MYIYIYFFRERERETACYFYACTHTTFCGSVRMETQPRELSPPFRLLPPTFPVTRVDELRHILRLKRREFHPQGPPAGKFIHWCADVRNTDYYGMLWATKSVCVLRRD